MCNEALDNDPRNDNEEMEAALADQLAELNIAEMIETIEFTEMANAETDDDEDECFGLTN